MASLHLPAATTRELARIASFIADCCASLLSPQALYQLQLAVDEACTNVLEHAYAGSGPLEIEVEQGEAQICVQLHDWGLPFDPTQAPPFDPTLPLERRPSGGMGIHLIRQSVDRVTYRTAGDRNTLTLVKGVLR